MATKTIKGLDTVLRNLNKEIKKIKGRNKRGITKATLFVRKESQKICPVDTGNLINSAFSNVKVKGKTIVGTVGYTAAYAPFVHEMVGAKFKKPTAEAKFLEKPLKENTKEILNIIKKEARIK